MKQLKPPMMGWSSWNYFRQSIDEGKIKEIAQAMKSSGLSDVGYQYIHLDDCWHSSKRSHTGELQFDLTNFSNGQKLIEEIHAMGLKVGLYSSSGAMTCEDLPGSYGHETIDAQTFHRWGVDFLKYDYCHVVDLNSDEKWLTQAPDIMQIEFYNQATKKRLMLDVKAGYLSGTARFEQAEGISFVTGLGGNQGQIIWEENISPGNYVVTVTYKKRKTEQRLLLTLQLGTQEIVIHFPTSSGWSLTGREQCEIFVEQKVEKLLVTNPIHDQKSDAMLRYQTMYQALKKAYGSEDFQFGICEHGRNAPWTWAQTISNQYRIAHDIQNNWDSVVSCYEKAVAVSKYAVEGSYGDPDMLEVGNNALSKIENQSHFSLWSFLAAPLILGNDLREFVKQGEKDVEASNQALEVLLNQPIIQFNQSRPYLPAYHCSKDSMDVLLKVLDNGKSGLIIFNKSEERRSFSIDLASLPKTVHGNKFEYQKKEMKEAWGKPVKIVKGIVMLEEILAHEVYVLIFG
ncbi:glycoside hydrolase family 27 protein [Enterococcus sp. LJL98]